MSCPGSRFGVRGPGGWLLDGRPLARSWVRAIWPHFGWARVVDSCSWKSVADDKDPRLGDRDHRHRPDACRSESSRIAGSVPRIWRPRPMASAYQLICAYGAQRTAYGVAAWWGRESELEAPWVSSSLGVWVSGGGAVGVGGEVAGLRQVGHLNGCCPVRTTARLPVRGRSGRGSRSPSPALPRRVARPGR
jgi:hypothetical protein